MRHSNRQGFTLLEVVFAVAVLTIASLTLALSLSSSQTMTALSRERAIANNVLRAFVERTRKEFPQNTNDTNMIELIGHENTGGTASTNFTDASTTPDSTPIFDLQKLYASGLVEHNTLKNASASVFVLTDETGANWGPGVTASINTPTSVAAVSSSALSASDAVSLGMGFSAPFGRDLNGNGTTTETNVVTYQSTNNQNVVLVPMKIQLTWTSGSSNDFRTPSTQTVTTYAIFSPQH